MCPPPWAAAASPRLTTAADRPLPRHRRPPRRGRTSRSTSPVIFTFDGSTFALPFGIWPKNKALAVSGEWEGVKYNHRAVLLVGSEPAYSRYDKRLDVMALPRVQAIDDEFKRWLPFLEAHRYVSDGDPDTITVPETEAARLNSETVKGKKVRTYQSSS